MKITSHQINIKDQKDFLKEVLGEQSPKFIFSQYSLGFLDSVPERYRYVWTITTRCPLWVHVALVFRQL